MKTTKIIAAGLVTMVAGGSLTALDSSITGMSSAYANGKSISSAARATIKTRLAKPGLSTSKPFYETSGPSFVESIPVDDVRKLKGSSLINVRKTFLKNK